MKQSMGRKDFLVLTLTLTTLGMSAACGDDEDDQHDDGPAGNGGSSHAGSGGESAGGHLVGGSNAGSNSSGASTSGNTGTGGGGGQGSGGAPETDIGGAGGQKVGGEAGGSAVSGDGGAAGDGSSSPNVGGSGGEGGAGPACQQATLAQEAGGHDHLPADPKALFTSFTHLLKGSNPTATFALPMDLGHSHNIMLTRGEVEQLLRGETISKNSTKTSDHFHTYTISCG